MPGPYCGIRLRRKRGGVRHGPEQEHPGSAGSGSAAPGSQTRVSEDQANSRVAADARPGGRLTRQVAKQHGQPGARRRRQGEKNSSGISNRGMSRSDEQADLPSRGSSRRRLERPVRALTRKRSQGESRRLTIDSRACLRVRQRAPLRPLARSRPVLPAVPARAATRRASARATRRRSATERFRRPRAPG